MSFSTRNLDTIVESDSHSPLADPGSVILPTQSSNSGKFDFSSKRNSAPVNPRKSNINNNKNTMNNNDSNNNDKNNFIGNNTIPKTKNMEKINSNIHSNSMPMNVHKSGIKVTTGGAKDKARDDKDRIGIRLKKSSSTYVNDNQDDNSDHNSDNINNNIRNTHSSNTRNSDKNIQQQQKKQQKEHEISHNIDDSNDDDNDPHGIRISQSASCGSANNNNHNNDNKTHNTNDNIQFDDHNNTHTLTNNHNNNNSHTLNPNHPHNPPSSPPCGRSRSFSTGTGTTSHLNDSSISTASSGFFSRLLATPSKRLKKLNECENSMNRKDKDKDNHRDKEKSHSLGYNSNHYGGHGGGGGEKGSERGGGCGNASERERERERGDEESVGSRGGMSVETNRVSDHYTYDEQSYEETVYIKSKLCLRVSVKSSSRYRLCDSNPQEEGDATWACATGIFAQSFILRGDDCDTDSRLVASDRLVSIIVDSKITNVNGELKIENKHNNSVKDSYNSANTGITDNDHLPSTSEKSKKETKVY